MPKLDVGVGDEFPAKEVKDEPSREEEPVIHHHHYYRGRYRDYRYRGRWLWFVLWIMVVSALFRAFDMAAGTAGWAWSQWGGPWSGPWGAWMWGPFHAIQGLVMTILIIGGLIFISRWRSREEEREDERDQDDRSRDRR